MLLLHLACLVVLLPVVVAVRGGVMVCVVVAFLGLSFVLFDVNGVGVVVVAVVVGFWFFSW